MTEREVFLEALDKATPEARAAYLEEACAQDVTLRRKVDELLKEHFSNDGLLAGPALEEEQTAVVNSPAAESPALMLGRYKLLEKIGEGGFGEVWMAEQREPIKRRVALKIIKPGMDSRQIVARFEAERQALAMMDHPNIAKIFDAGTTENPHPPARPEPLRRGEGPASGHPLPSNERGAGGEGTPHVSAGRPYFVMELVRGIKITEYCDQNQLPTRERLRLFILVCQAIQHAHQKGIIHRDIKPSNILVTLHDGVPVPKVIDFGIAKATQQELTDKTVFTQFQQFMGTPAYISPEQAEMSGLDIDTRADIYSLGVLLYELLVGQTPFDAKEMIQGGLDELRRIIREKEPLRPSTKLNTLPGEARTTAGKRRQTDVGKLVHQLQGDLDWIVMKCLEKDRSRRYDTANGLAADLKRHLNNEPVVARPPTAAYRFQKAFRRNKVVFAAGAAIVLALVLGVIGTTIGLVRTERQRQAAEQKQAEAETERRRADAQARQASESQQQSRRLLYAADMNLAQQSLKLNNLGRARRLLDRNRPQSGEEDLRGWEWRYLWQLTRSSALVTLTNRPAVGFGVSFSPDGRYLAVNWDGGRVDLWDVPARRWMRALTDPAPSYHEGRVAFSPVRNLLATTPDPKAVTLYDLDSGRESILWRAPDGDGWSVRDFAFSPDGSRLVIYAGTYKRKPGDEVWVVNVSSSRVESRHPAAFNDTHIHGAAQLSPDNRLLYLARSDSKTYSYSIQCIDLTTGQELWQTERIRDYGLSTLAVPPDGRVLASGSGYEDPTILIWDAANGRLLDRLDGHTGWVSELVFSRDGQRLISASGDQSIRFWDTSDWSETKVLRGHTDEIHSVAISPSGHSVASASKDGDLMLWRADGQNITDGYRRLPGDFGGDDIRALDQSRVLLLPPGKTAELVDLGGESPPVSMPEIGSSTNILGWFGTNILCEWNGTNQVILNEWRGTGFIQRGAMTLNSGTRPAGTAYDTRRQILAWTEATNSTSVYFANLAQPDSRVELKSDIPGLARFRFNKNGDYLVAKTKRGGSLRAWNIETRQIIASIDDPVWDAHFAADGRVLVVAIGRGSDHEIRFYDFARPDREPRRVSQRYLHGSLAVSADGGLVACSTHGGLVRLFDPGQGKLIGTLHGHLNAVHGVSFAPDGQRLISTSGGREAVKVWDVGTRQELLTLSGAGSVLYAARWSADGAVILAGAPWQAWRAPSWEEIAAAEAKDPPSFDFGGQGKAESKKP